MKRKKTKDFNYACPREFTTGRWHVHLVYPVNPAQVAAYQKARTKIPLAPTRWSSSTIPRITVSS